MTLTHKLLAAGALAVFAAFPISSAFAQSSSSMGDSGSSASSAGSMGGPSASDARDGRRFSFGTRAKRAGR